jgi:arabinogalactan endo-1,4-beta-galactosidase
MLYLGADFSYVNEVEDAGGVYRMGDAPSDPFTILRRAGANLARVRLWHTPQHTPPYSGLDDVTRTLQRARALGYSLLLDFHYSDWWADPAKQIIPAAWAHLDGTGLEQALYDYTRGILLHLHALGLMPEFVQVGNEINTELMLPEPHAGQPIRWERNARLLNTAIRAVRDAGQYTAAAPQVMLHIAQPEFVIDWFDAAHQAGVHDFDVIGLSYYPKWSAYGIQQMGQTIANAVQRYGKPLMLVETAYPWTQTPHLAEFHLLSEDAVLPDYPATPEGQRDFLIDVTRTVQNAGGIGVVYWEPAWISTPAKPSIWENAALFDYNGAPHSGITFLSHNYTIHAEE